MSNERWALIELYRYDLIASALAEREVDANAKPDTIVLL